ncbi:hypothetical protein Cfor_05148, partial [Coptotermes formosanus]
SELTVERRSYRTAPVAHETRTDAALRLGRSAEGRNAGPDSARAGRPPFGGRLTRRHRPGPAPAASASRPNPTRPGPQSQSLFRSYGSNLPTSLTYIILSTRGSSPWRPAADMGTNRRDISTYIPHLNFQGFHGTRTLRQKRKLFPDLSAASSGHFGLPRRTLAFNTRERLLKRFRCRVPE